MPGWFTARRTSQAALERYVPVYRRTPGRRDGASTIRAGLSVTGPVPTGAIEGRGSVAGSFPVGTRPARFTARSAARDRMRIPVRSALLLTFAPIRSVRDR